MKRSSTRFAIAAIGLVLIGGLAVMGDQLRHQRQLHRELARLRAEFAALQNLRAENERLAAERAALEQRTRSHDHAAMLTRLRDEVDALRARANQTPAASPARTKVAPIATKTGGVTAAVPVSGWTDAGTASPHATVETVLWAAAGGDVEVLVQLLELSAAARAAANALFASLSPSERAVHGTPERLVALLTAADVPLGVVRWSEPVLEGADTAVLRVQLRDAAGQERAVNLRLQRRADGWRLVVPESAIQTYAASIRETPR